ncbi:MAG: VWA domain-containing protein [Gemmataceae bacterium]|nr:VWA domain-containing protein [Gemmataceae bacterium]
MGFFNRLFGGGSSAAKEEPSHQLPSSMVAQEFGEVNVRKVGAEVEVVFTVLMEPQGVEAEGWQTGVALDASGSMQGVYGRGLEPGRKGPPPDEVWRDYIRRGLMQVVEQNGQQYPILTEACKDDLVSKGWFVWSENTIEPLARGFTAYLAGNLDADGGTTVVYWACGDGSGIEEVGDLTAADCKTANFPGPRRAGFGEGTFLTPAVRHFVDKFPDAKNGMYLFVTDGELNDLDEVKRYTRWLCKEIAAGRRNPVKCVLIGVGENINEGQMEELDDLESGTGVDVWDHKIAKEMRGLTEIFAEVVGENTIVAPTAKLYDPAGAVVRHFADGMPARVTFRMPAASASFELEVGDQRIKQSVVLPKKK